VDHARDVDEDDRLERDPGGRGKAFAGQLPQPKTNKEFYRDVAVIAVPADAKDTAPTPTITSSAEGVDLVKLSDGDAKTEVTFPEGKSTIVTFAYPEAVSRRLLKIDVAPPGTQLKYLGLIQVSDDGKKFRTVLNFNESTGTAPDWPRAVRAVRADDGEVLPRETSPPTRHASRIRCA
jgi:hypothetical protein